MINKWLFLFILLNLLVLDSCKLRPQAPQSNGLDFLTRDVTLDFMEIISLLEIGEEERNRIIKAKSGYKLIELLSNQPSHINYLSNLIN